MENIAFAEQNIVSEFLLKNAKVKRLSFKWAMEIQLVGKIFTLGFASRDLERFQKMSML